MWPYGPKNRQKMVIFSKNLPLGKNYGGRLLNLNIRAQLQTFLYAMTPELFFFKLHRFIAFPLSQTSSFFGMRKFVIMETRDKKQTNKKHHTFLSTAGARPRIPTILGMVISSGVARGGLGLWGFNPSSPHSHRSLFHSRKVTVIKYYNLSLTTRKTINLHDMRKTNHLGGGGVAGVYCLPIDTILW